MNTPDDHLRPPVSRSTTRSRPHSVQRVSTSSITYLPHNADVLETNVSEETVGLLHDLVSHRNRSKARMRTDDTLVVSDAESQSGGRSVPKTVQEEEEEEEEEDWEAMQKRPWYRRPTPLWCVVTDFVCLYCDHIA